MNLARFSLTAVVVILLTCVGCSSRDEVTRVSSPDGRVDAVLFETNGGATTSFGYEIELARKGHRGGSSVASFYGAARNDQAYGVDLSWKGNDELAITYRTAEQPPIIRNAIDMDGKHIRIFVQGGVTNPNAPAGGMLYNLQKK